MPLSRLMLAVLLCAVLFAQTQQDSSKPAAPAQAESDVIKTTVNVVTAPVTVFVAPSISSILPALPVPGIPT